MLVVRAMFTPLATMLPAAFTRLIADAFCSALPARLMLEFVVAVRLEPSTAMFCAAAEPKLSAPWMLFVTWSEETLLLFFDFDCEATNVAAVLVVELLDELLLWFQEELCAVFVLLLLALFEAEAFCEALLSLDDFEVCAIVDEDLFALEFADFESFAAWLAFELELLADAD